MACYTNIAFLDDNNPLAVGKLADYIDYVDKFDHAFVAIGNLPVRAEWIQRLQKAGFVLPVLKHPQAAVMSSAKVGAGSIIEAMAVVNVNTVVGDGCIISCGAVVNHNVEVGACCHIDCGAVVPSNKKVPPQTKILCGTVYHSVQED